LLHNALADYLADLHRDPLHWRVADLPAAMGIALTLTQSGPPPLSTVLVDGQQAMIGLPVAVADSMLAPGAIAAACARIWYLRHGYSPTRFMVQLAAPRLAVPEVLARRIHDGMLTVASVASLIGAPRGLVTLRLSLDASPAEHHVCLSEHEAWLDHRLRVLQDGLEV
jgi:hypothetical protein